MKTIKLYSASELKEINPDGFEKALDRWRDGNTEIFWADETIESLKAIIKASGLDLRQYNIDPYYPSSSWLKITRDKDTAELSGNRALAWLENNLLADLRERKPFNKRVKRYSHDGNKPHVYTRYGEIPDCPFTGYCADDDFLNALIKAIKSGDTLEDAYNNLAFVAGKILEGEMEYQNSEEYFIEHADANEYQFTAEGQMVY